MKFITKLLFILNIAIWIGAGAVCWVLTGSTLGSVILIGFVAFLIAWAISDEAIIVSCDNFTNPEWHIFTRRILWATSASLISMGIFIFICVAMDKFNMREFLNMKSS